MDRATVCARDPSLRLKNGYAQVDKLTVDFRQTCTLTAFA